MKFKDLSGGILNFHKKTRLNNLEYNKLKPNVQLKNKKYIYHVEKNEDDLFYPLKN